MNFIKLLVIIGIGLVIQQLVFNLNTATSYNYKQTFNSTTTLQGRLPNAYQVKIKFLGENYEYTHTYNDGSYPILVTVESSYNFLSSGTLKQLCTDLDCSISTKDDRLKGNLNFHQIINTLGYKDQKAVKKKAKDTIIQSILDKIRKL